MYRFSRRLVTAFTLVELVVIIVIIGIAALMALPAIALAQGNTHRAACASNLADIGKALASFGEQHDSYLPCWTFPGVDPTNTKATLRYEHANPLDGFEQTVKVGGKAGRFWMQNGPVYFRTLAFGYKNEGGDDMYGTNTLNAAPVGLGLLSVNGYLPTINKFLCPSATEMPADYGVNAARQFTPSGLKAFKSLGDPAKPEVLLFGDYSKIGWLFNPEATSACGLQSSYNYRCVPTTVLNEDHAFDSYLFKSVKPTLKVDKGWGQFKTFKTLGGRAIVADTFSRHVKKIKTATHALGASADFNAERTTGGFAKYAHQDGYNVLYGDLHVAWYADPKQRIMNWNRKISWRPNDSASVACTKNRVLADDDKAAPAKYQGQNHNMAWAIWHKFDRGAGIDRP